MEDNQEASEAASPASYYSTSAVFFFLKKQNNSTCIFFSFTSVFTTNENRLNNCASFSLIAAPWTQQIRGQWLVKIKHFLHTFLCSFEQKLSVKVELNPCWPRIWGVLKFTQSPATWHLSTRLCGGVGVFDCARTKCQGEVMWAFCRGARHTGSM